MAISSPARAGTPRPAGPRPWRAPLLPPPLAAPAAPPGPAWRSAAAARLENAAGLRHERRDRHLLRADRASRSCGDLGQRAVPPTGASWRWACRSIWAFVLRGLRWRLLLRRADWAPLSTAAAAWADRNYLSVLVRQLPGPGQAGRWLSRLFAEARTPAPTWADARHRGGRAHGRCAGPGGAAGRQRPADPRQPGRERATCADPADRRWAWRGPLGAAWSGCACWRGAAGRAVARPLAPVFARFVAGLLRTFRRDVSCRSTA